MKKILLVLIFTVVAIGTASATDKMMASDLRGGMHKLWEDHIVYTRNFIISFAGNLPDQDAVPQDFYKIKLILEMR